MTVILDSPYGYLTTPGGGKILNESVGRVVSPYIPGRGISVIFNGFFSAVDVPAHWLKTESETNEAVYTSVQA